MGHPAPSTANTHPTSHHDHLLLFCPVPAAVLLAVSRQSCSHFGNRFRSSTPNYHSNQNINMIDIESTPAKPLTDKVHPYRNHLLIPCEVTKSLVNDGETVRTWIEYTFLTLDPELQALLPPREDSFKTPDAAIEAGKRWLDYEICVFELQNSATAVA